MTELSPGLTDIEYLNEPIVHVHLYHTSLVRMLTDYIIDLLLLSIFSSLDRVVAVCTEFPCTSLMPSSFS